MSIPFFSTFLTAWQHLPPRCSLQGTLFIRTAVPLLSLLFLYPAPSAQAQSSAIKIKNKDYLLITADANDTPEELLERYNLDAFNCNEAHFYKINKIKKGGALKAGKEYQLPILIVDYNGSSIRTSLGIEDWRVAKRIETFNREALKRKLRNDYFVESTNLWVPWHELECPDKKATDPPAPTPEERVLKVGKFNAARLAKIPKEPTTGSNKDEYPLYGKALRKTKPTSQSLKNKVFYIVAGHGGPDVGAQGNRSGHTLCEDEYAYDVALRLHRLLISHGAFAYMIVRDPNDGIRDEALLDCDKDEVVWGNRLIPYAQKERLQQRCDIINDLMEQYLKAGIAKQTLVEIHVDSRSKHAHTDVFFYYRPEDIASQTLARRVQRVFTNKYMQVQGGRQFEGTVTPRYLYMLRESYVPRAVYIELGNIRNDWDQQRLILRNNRQALANWIFEGIRN
jgi:N-acetylmuramoyl-L-alanine amidase